MSDETLREFAEGQLAAGKLYSFEWVEGELVEVPAGEEAVQALVDDLKENFIPIMAPKAEGKG